MLPLPLYCSFCGLELKDSDNIKIRLRLLIDKSQHSSSGSCRKIEFSEGAVFILGRSNRFEYFKELIDLENNVYCDSCIKNNHPAALRPEYCIFDRSMLNETSVCFDVTGSHEYAKCNQCSYTALRKPNKESLKRLFESSY